MTNVCLCCFVKIIRSKDYWDLTLCNCVIINLFAKRAELRCETVCFARSSGVFCSLKHTRLQRRLVTMGNQPVICQENSYYTSP